MLSKNDIITLEISSISSDGSGIGKYDGMVVFVPNTAVGDVIKCKILKVNKTYSYGKCEEVLSPSEHRISPDCESFYPCGGCVFRHVSYDEELRYKQGFVRDSFRRIGGFDIEPEPIADGPSVQRYRNKVQLPIAYLDGKADFGMFSPRSHRVTKLSDCLLQPEVFTAIESTVMRYINDKNIPVYDETSGRGLVRHIYLRRGHHSGEIMLCLVCTKRTDKFDGIVKPLIAEFPNIKTILINVNPAKTNVILGVEYAKLYGNGTICDTMCGVSVEISPSSFYQVNTPVAEAVYRYAKDCLNLSGSETLLDLYCGIGTVGLSMADCVKNLVGVEIVPEAIENAKRNAKANGIENAEFHIGDAGDISKKLVKNGEMPDVIVLDPPRKGCDDRTISAVIQMSPKKILYISCNPATCARDVKKLSESGYRFKKYKPFDLFPRTGHVETVVLMSQAGA